MANELRAIHEISKAYGKQHKPGWEANRFPRMPHFNICLNNEAKSFINKNGI
jgi:hypothetical protein